jgi:hypothetical protein
MRRIPLLLSLALLVACQDSSLAPPAPAPAPFVEGIVLAPSQAELDAKPAHLFSFATLPSLWVRVKLKELPEMAPLKLSFLAPNGALFYEATRVYSQSAEVQEQPTAMGMMPVHHPLKVEGGFLIDWEVAVGGTIFQRRPMGDGTWHLEVTLAGRPGTLSTDFQTRMR